MAYDYSIANSNNYYQGPVPQGYNEALFRLTGRTVPSTSTSKQKGGSTSNTKKSSGSSSSKKKQKSYEDYMKDVAKKARQALIKKYEAGKASAEQQLADLSQSKALTESDINNAITGYQGQVEGQKQKIWGSVEEGINKARNTAQDVTRAGRNTLRGLGILGSTYAAEKLQAPLSEFSSQRADLYKQGQQQINDLDTLLTNKVGELKSQLAQVSLKFSQMANDIKSDIRFSEAERDDALAQLEASLADKVAQARQQAAAFSQQIAQAKMNISTQLASAFAQANPTADLNSILNAGITGMENLTESSGFNAYGEEENPYLAYMYPEATS